MSYHEESVTTWLGGLKAGRTDSAEKLWNRYVERLVRLARRKLGRGPRRVADEEDVVLAAFTGFLAGVADGRFVKLDDRDDVWQVLVMLTERRAIGQRKHQLARKRGSGKVRGESVFMGLEGDGSYQPGLAQEAAHEPTPEFAVEMTDMLRHLIDSLPDDVRRQIVLGKLAGQTHEQIAEELGVGVRTVERKWGIIRDKWRQEGLDG